VSENTTTFDFEPKAALTVTAPDAIRVQGSANPTFAPTYVGFVYGDTAASLTTPPTCTTTATTASPVGTYPITCSGGASNNYDFAYVAGTINVTAGVTAAPTVEPTELVEAATGTPVRAATLPPTSAGGKSAIGGDSTPLFALLICLAFGALGLLAVATQRRSIRR
jgi:hypothetical protein